MIENTCISPSDLKAFQHLLKKHKEGQEQATKAQATLQDTAKREASLQGYFGYLAEAYGLVEGQGIDENGNIVTNGQLPATPTPMPQPLPRPRVKRS